MALAGQCAASVTVDQPTDAGFGLQQGHHQGLDERPNCCLRISLCSVTMKIHLMYWVSLTFPECNHQNQGQVCPVLTYKTHIYMIIVVHSTVYCTPIDHLEGGVEPSLTSNRNSMHMQ